MKDTKLIQLLNTFTAEELSAFESFLFCPLFNERIILRRLYKEIRKFYPAFDNERFTRENLFAKVYPRRKFSDELLRNTASRLFRCAEKFIALEAYKKDWFGQQKYLLEELTQRGLSKFFVKKFEDLKKNADTLPHDSEFNYQHQLACLQMDNFFRFNTTDTVPKEVLENREKALKDYFASDLVALYNMMSHDALLHPEKQYGLSMLQWALKYISENPKVMDNQFVKINFYVVNLLTSGDEQYYFLARNFLKESSCELSRDEKARNYTALFTFIQSQIFRGRHEKLKEKLELYKEAFKNEGVYFKGKVKHAEIILAVSCSLSLSDFMSAEMFLSQYIDQTEEYFKENTKEYCLGMIAYYKKDFSLALSHLLKVDYINPTFKYLVRSLILMTYFSSNDAEGFYSLADSYRHFLETTEKDSFTYSAHSNFIRLTLNLFRGRENRKRFDIQAFRKQLNETYPVIKKQWLMTELEKMESTSLSRQKNV